MKKIIKLLLVVSLLSPAFVFSASTAGVKKTAPAQVKINPEDYPAIGDEELGQLRWVMKIANQDLSDFTNFQQVDDQGVSACRYSIAFSAYFLALEQYHKFPAWRDGVRVPLDRLIQRMLQKRIWQYWAHESQGVTKFEPNMDRPYPQNLDPVSYGNIMYSGHVGQMINLYQMLYNDLKWDAPGSMVFNWDDKTQFVYDNKKLQEVMFLQMMENPVPGIECERNAIFPACNTHPMLSWLLYDKTHGTRYFDAAHPLFDKFFETQFINPKTHALGAFYLIKQGWVFSAWNPKYGNKMDPLIAEMVKKGVNFNSSGNDGWIATFMHGWNPKLIESLYPYMKKDMVKNHPDGSATLNTDPLAADAYYAFFTALTAEVGDAKTRDGLLKTIDAQFSPVWQDGTYHYPFMDKVATVNLAADDSAKKTPAVQTSFATAIQPQPEPAKQDAKAGLCCKAMHMQGHGDANNMKTMPQHSDVSDKLIAIARALPKSGIWTMHNKPFDAAHFSQPYVTGIDINKLALKRAVYDAKKKALIVSTNPNKDNPTPQQFMISGLDKTKTYVLSMDGLAQAPVTGVDSFPVSIEKTCHKHDIVLLEK